MRKKQTIKRRLLSFMLAVVLILSSITVVQAQEVTDAGTTKNETEQTQETVTQPEIPEQSELSDQPEMSKQPELSANEKKQEQEESVQDAPQDEAKKTGMGITTTLRVDGYGKSVVYPTTVTLPDTYKTFADYGLSGVEDPGFYTVLHMMAQYCVDMELDPSQEIDVRGLTLYNYLGAASGQGTFFMYMVNNIFPMDENKVGHMMPKCPVKEGDYAVIYDWYWLSDNAVYSYFEDEDMQVNANELLAVQLKAKQGMAADTEADASNARIIVTDTKGNEITDPERCVVPDKTDENGRAKVAFFEPGTYLLTAERINSAGNNELNRPYAKVTVGNAVELTDAQAVSAEKEVLSIGDISALTEKVELPKAGRYNTTIEWSSSDEKIINPSTGKVARPVDQNPIIELTAEISKGQETTEKKFEATVIGKTTELEHLSTNHGNLQFSPKTRDYTIYVPTTDREGKSIIQLEVTARPTDDASSLKIAGETFSIETGNVFTNKTKVVKLKEDTTNIKLEVSTDGAQGTIVGTTTITVKRGDHIGAPLPDLPNIEWGQHLGDKNNNAVVDSKSPIEHGTLLWESFSHAPDDFGRVCAGTPILVNNTIYAVQNNRLKALDAKTGEVKQSVSLLRGIGYYANITYGGGMIFVPLANGQVQCFNATSLTSMFVTEQPGGLLGKFTIGGSIHYADGEIYVGYADYIGNGYFAAFDTVDLDTTDTKEVVTARWTSGTGDYYGTGGVTVGNYVVFAGDKGTVSSVDIRTGKEADTCELEGKVSGAVVYADNALWMTTKEKKVYKLGIDESGALTVLASAAMPLGSNASPAVSDGKVYVTGGSFDGGGFFAVYDMDLNQLASKQIANPANTPTVTTAYDEVYAYFTENSETGSLYVAKVTADNEITVTKVFTPPHAQYCMSRVLIGADGTIYYENDAGYIYAIVQGDAPQEPPAPEEPEEPVNPEPPSTPQLPQQPQPDKLPMVNRGQLNEIKKTARLSSRKTEEKATSEEKLIKAINSNKDAGKKSLTIKNPPEMVEASVFAELSKNPDFRLVLDCGSYTISIKGSDVKDTSASLSTKLVEKAGALSKQEAEKMGNYQQLEFIQDGNFPGTIQIVYKLPENLKKAEAIYVYESDAQTLIEDAVVQKEYAMFSIEKPGMYILSDQKIGEVSKISDNTEEVAITNFPEGNTKAPSVFPQWAGILLGVIGGALVGGVATGAVVAKRKRKDTWEKEE